MDAEHLEYIFGIFHYNSTKETQFVTSKWLNIHLGIEQGVKGRWELYILYI